MELQTFKDSLDRERPPADLTSPLCALWHQAKGDWHRAYSLVQDERTEAAAWVRAFLSRVEGDAASAAHWYSVAGRAHSTDSLSSEWREIAGHLLETMAEPALEMDH